MCVKRYFVFLESEGFPAANLLSLRWDSMSEGMWSTSCLFYFVASLKDRKPVSMPEFNKNKIVLAKIELLPCLLLNRVKWVRLAEALLGFQWNSSSRITLTDAQPSPRPKPQHQPTVCVREHLCRSLAQEHICKNLKTFWLPRDRSLDSNPVDRTCSHQLP